MTTKLMAQYSSYDPKAAPHKEFAVCNVGESWLSDPTSFSGSIDGLFVQRDNNKAKVTEVVVYEEDGEWLFWKEEETDDSPSH